MKTKTLIYWKDALISIEKGETLIDVELDFNNETMMWHEAMKFGKAGFFVPQELIDYDEENIDYSDDEGSTDEDYETGRLIRVHQIKIPIRMDIERWINQEKINIAKLLENLLNEHFEKQQSEKS